MSADVGVGLSAAKQALLAQRVSRGADRSGRMPVTPRSDRGPAPLSSAQEQLWYHSQLAPESLVYNEVVTVRKDGDFDAAVFARAFNEIVRRHEAWRTRFGLVDGVPMQIPVAHVDLELPVVDLRHLPPEDREAAAVTRAAAESRRPYDLVEGPLIRPLLVRLSDGHHRLYLGMHHLIFDGVSLYRIVLPELIAIYDAYAAGRESPLAPPQLQYADYAAWEQATAAAQPGNGGALDYWREHLRDAPTLALPLDHPRPARQRFRGGVEPLPMSADLVDRLRAVGRSSDATLFQVLATAFAVFLRTSSGQDDIVFGTVADLRRRPELETMVGYCLSPLVVRADFRGEPSFLELTAGLRRDLLEGLDHHVPFGRLVRELHPRRDPGVNPLFQAMLVLEPPMTTPDPAWSIHQMEPEIGSALGHAKLDLSIDLDERPEGGVDGRLTFNTDLFDAPTARRMAARWLLLLEGIVADPGRPLADLTSVTDEERHQLVAWNRSERHLPLDTCLHELTAAQARRTPDVPVADGCERSTFAEIDERAGRLATRLRQLGAGPEQLVGVCMPRSVDLLVALLGVLKAGAAFLPLEPEQPSGRLEAMVDEAQPVVVITTAPAVLSVPSSGARLLELDSERAEWMRLAPTVATDCGPNSLAYVLYTSGSTGRPKGVMVEHHSLVNQLLWMSESFALGDGDHVLHKTPLGFDPALWELFCPLLSGAALTVLSPRHHADPHRMVAAVREHRITVMSFVPSMLEEFIAAAKPGGCDSLRLVTSGGETTTPALVHRFHERFPGVELRNMYGPTEATITSSWWRCLPDQDAGALVPIGFPVANTQLHVLDARLRPVPIGTPGELCIGGAQVARGYLLRPEVSDDAFVPDPFTPGGRLYRSGDIARRRNDGSLEFLGRRDGQVKIHGVRIELGEIESALAADLRVRQAAVALRRDGDGQPRLVAYVVPRRRADPPDLGELRAFLSQRLLSSMIPSALVIIDHLPAGVTGKVDRLALPEPDWRPMATFRAPGTPLETRLAALWARVLRLPRVGVDDDFFELGGHSLLAVRLLVRVEREFGVTVPLPVLFESSATVARMASSMECVARSGRAGMPAEAAPERGTSPPLFFIQPGESALLTLRHFTRAIGPRQRVVGLLPERVGARFDQSRSIEELAATILGTIRETQPAGPYFISGFSMGGLLAYEVATQLRGTGEEVAWLAILDSDIPALAREGIRRRLSLSQRFARQRARGLRGSIRHTVTVLEREAVAALVRLHLRRSRLGDDFDWRGALRIASRYQCAGNDAPMDLFVTADGVADSGSATLGWEQVHRGQLRVHTVPGGHVSMLTEPTVTMVARMVTESLRAAQADHSVAA